MPQVKFQIEKGFTLIEIIVAIGIIALISAIVIPGLRNFNKDQQLETASNDLVQAIKQTQSNAMSRIACPSGNPTSGWKITINPTTYQQKAICIDFTGGTTPTPQPFPIHTFTPSTISMFNNSCMIQSKSTTLEITYTGNIVAFNCINGIDNPAVGIQPVEIYLRDTSSSTQRILKINNAGVIEKE